MEYSFPILLVLATIACGSSSTVETDGRMSEAEDSISLENAFQEECASCPEFVAVPKAPSGLRDIRFVSKYELTWNNYLAAYDDGSCAIPNPNSGFASSGANDIEPHVDLYRIDWPVGLLGVDDVNCYIDWIQEKTGHEVALPTPREWEWFARAGNSEAKFPWGDEVDATREALEWANISPGKRRPWSYAEGGELVNRRLDGVRVGQFEPNAWGLHDVMGNASELTSDFEFGADGKPSRVVMKGAYVGASNWARDGISGVRHSAIKNGRFSARPVPRLVLIIRGDTQ